MKRLFNWLVEEGILDHNPSARIRNPRPPVDQPKAISIENARCLLKTAAETGEAWEQKRNIAMILFLADTGCRLAGLLGLMLDDVDLQRGVAKVCEKGHQWRFVFMHPPTIAAMRRWLEEREQIATQMAGNAIWIARGGRSALTKWGVENVFRRLRKRAGITAPASPHSFRHRFAINYLLDGGDLASLADILGHRDMDTTKEYYAKFQFAELQAKHNKHSLVNKLIGD